MLYLIILVVGYRSATSYGYSYSSNIKGVAVTYDNNYDITIKGEIFWTYTFYFTLIAYLCCFQVGHKIRFLRVSIFSYICNLILDMLTESNLPCL